MPATAENINTMKQQEKAKRAQEAAEKAEAEATAQRLKEITVQIKAKAGNGGRLFGAVTSKEISDALSEQFGISIPKAKIVQDELHLGPSAATTSSASWAMKWWAP